MKKIIAYFADRHLLVNLIMFSTLIGAVIFWNRTNKEEMPDVTFNRIVVSAMYPGASAQEMEDFIARPLETELKGIDGIDEMTTTVNTGSATVALDISPDVDDFNETVNEVRTAVANADLPDDMQSDPVVRYFKTSQRAVLDVYIYDTNQYRIKNSQRDTLQTHARNLADRLLSLPQVSDVNYNGLQNYRYVISLDPRKLERHQVSISQVSTALRNNHIRLPLGSLEMNGKKTPARPSSSPATPPRTANAQKVDNSQTKAPGKTSPRMGFFESSETKLTLDADLLTIDEIRNIIVRGNFEGQMVRVKDLARVYTEYEKESTLHKINGFEAIQITITKSGAYGILEAVDEVKKTVSEFQETTLGNTSIKAITSDDESLSIRNRLSFIAANGAMGFFLVLVILFIFLNFKSGFWVAMGIPFSFGVTMILASLMGFTINNITLSAVIIVMGMIVDDAIVVSENITRMKEQGYDDKEAVVTGTAYVLLPIIGSIVTTCIAFIPVLNFQGRMGLMVRNIPPIIFMILGASLFESIFLLPSHLQMHIPRNLRVIFSLGTLPLIEKYFARRKEKSKKKSAAAEHAHWFYRVENWYEKVLRVVLHHRLLLFISFLGLLLLSGWIFVNKMRYVMFPRTESTEIFIRGETAPGMKRDATEAKVREIEVFLDPYVGKEALDYVTYIARGRFGMQSTENTFQIIINLVDKEKRRKSAAQIISEIQSSISNTSGFYKVNTTTMRFGPSSGSALDIAVTGNPQERLMAVSALLDYMARDNRFVNPEVEEVMLNSEYRIHLKRDEINRLGISPVHISEAFKTIAGGSRLYTDLNDDEEIDYILEIDTNRVQSLKEILAVPVANSAGYLVPLAQLVSVDLTNTPATLSRLNGRQYSMIHSDLNKASRITPLEAASLLEQGIFKELMKKYPSVNMLFQGEVKDSREAGDTFKLAIIAVIVMIYLILALIFNSLTRPLIIMLIIPFGVVGIILAFRMHGMLEYGFFAGIGALGLTGVVINDSIVMIDKLDKEFKNQHHHSHLVDKVSAISKTRLRAVLLTTLTTVAGLMPTAYGVFGYDAMLAEMMLGLSWGLIFGTTITLLLVPAIYVALIQLSDFLNQKVVGKLAVIPFISLLLLVPGRSEAQTNNTTPVLGLKDYLILTRENNIRFQLLALDQLKTTYDYRLSLPLDELMVSALFDLQYRTANQTFYTGWGLGLSKLFASTGTELNFSYSASPTTSPFTGSTPVVSSSLSLEAVQPLLANAFGLVHRLTIKKAVYTRDISLFEIQELYEDYLQQLIQQYYHWYSLETQKEIALQSLALIQQTRRIVQQKYQSRIADLADLNRASIQVLEQENQVKALEQQLKQVRAEMAKTLNLSATLKYTPLYPDISFTNPQPDFETSWQTFITKSRTVHSARLLAEQNALSIDIAQQNFLPELNAVAGMTWADRSYNPFVSGSFNIGVEFSYLLPDARDQATLEKSRILTRQAQLSLTNLLNSSRLDMELFWDALQYQKDLRATLEQRISLMELVVQTETRTYQQGRSSLSDLLNEINKLRIYRLEYLLSTIELEKAYLSWASHTDQLLEHLDMILAD